MEDDKKRILSFLCWYTKDELTDHMQFALGFYTVFCICMFPFPFETFGARSPILYIILGIELFLWIAYAVWYKIIKNSEENKISAAYLHAGTVFGTTSLVLFGSAALSFQSSGIPFGRAHILANAAGIFLNLFVLTVRIIQYKSKKFHTFGPIYGAGAIMPLVFLGKALLDNAEKSAGKGFIATVVLTLGGYLILCFSLVLS